MTKELELLIAEDETEIRGFVGYVAPGRPRERIFKRDWATIRMLSVDPGQTLSLVQSRKCRDAAQYPLDRRSAYDRRARIIWLHNDKEHSNAALYGELQLFCRVKERFDR